MSVDGDAPTAEEGPITATSLRLAYPTTAADWPRWTDPVHPEREAQLPHLDDGTPHPCLHPADVESAVMRALRRTRGGDRKSTRLNSSHVAISFAVCCLKKNTDSLLHVVSSGVNHEAGQQHG